MEDASGTKSITELRSEGDLPCVIIYSSSNHVEYIENIIDDVKEFLTKNCFKIALLSDEARDLKKYADEFVRISKKCVRRCNS